LRLWSLALVAAGLVLAGCAWDEPDPGLVLVADVVSTLDSAVADSVHSGLEALAPEGYQIVTIEAGEPADWEQSLEQVSGDYDIVVAGGELAAVVEQVAQRFPGQHYLLYDGLLQANNITSVRLRHNEAAFLAGALAGLATTDPGSFPLARGSKVVALVAGEGSLTERDRAAGFTAGAHAIDPTIQVLTVYLDSHQGSFYDSARDLFSAQRADVVFQTAAAQGAGALQAAAELDRYAIGSDALDNGLYRGHVLASVVEQVGPALETTLRGLADGSVSWGQTVSQGLAEGVVQLIYDDNGGVVPAVVLSQLETYATQIVDFELQVPTAPA
jgi:basic membrane protein A